MGTLQKNLRTAPPADAGLLEKFFQLKANGTNVKTEILAGLTTFMTMAYIIFVNPAILVNAGMDKGAVLVATALASAVATLFMGLYANYPFALAPGMGLNAFFAFGLVLGMGLTWQSALGAVFVSGCIAVIVTLTRLRESLIRAIPVSLKHAVAAGIGLFIALIGFKSAGLVIGDPNTLVTLANFTWSTPEGQSAMLALFGLLIMGALLVRRVNGAILLGILATAVIGYILGVSKPPTEIFSTPPSLAPTFFKLSFEGVFTAGMFGVIFSLFFVDLFDTIGTFVGVADRAKMIDEKGNLVRGNRALFADSIGTVVGSLLGTSNTTTYVESAAGVSAGGRTGLTAVVVAILFLASTFFSGVALAIPGYATAPALIMVGVLMAAPLMNIKFDDALEAIPAFLTVIMMPLSFSIATGLALGFISYVVLNMLAGRAKDVHWLMYILAVLFGVYFVVK